MADDVPQESELVRQIYAFVDRQSYLDWGLRTEDVVEVGTKRSAAMSSIEQWDGCVVHTGALFLSQHYG